MLDDRDILYLFFQLVVAVDQDEIPRLEALYERGIRNGAKDLVMVDQNQIKEIEPNCVVSNIIHTYSL